MLVAMGQHAPAATVFEDLLNLQEAAHGREAAQLFPTLLALGSAQQEMLGFPKAGAYVPGPSAQPDPPRASQLLGANRAAERGFYESLAWLVLLGACRPKAAFHWRLRYVQGCWLVVCAGP